MCDVFCVRLAHGFVWSGFLQHLESAIPVYKYNISYSTVLNLFSRRKFNSYRSLFVSRLKMEELLREKEIGAYSIRFGDGFGDHMIQHMHMTTIFSVKLPKRDGADQPSGLSIHGFCRRWL